MGAATVSLLIPNRKKNIKRCFFMNAKLRRIIIFFLKSFVNESNSVPKKMKKIFAMRIRVLIIFYLCGLF